MAAATVAYDSLLAELAIPHRAKAAYRALLKAGPDALPTMRRRLKHENADVRYWCCQYLDRFLEPEVMSELITMLDDADPRVRLTTLHTLACDRCKEGDCRPEEAAILPRAIGLLEGDPDDHVRAMSLEVVGRCPWQRDRGQRHCRCCNGRFQPYRAQESKMVRAGRRNLPANCLTRRPVP